MTPIPKEDALEACKTCPRRETDKCCIYADILSSKDAIHNPPECLIFQFKQISEQEHPHPIGSTGTQRTEWAGIIQTTIAKPDLAERFIAKTVEKWEKKTKISSRNEKRTTPRPEAKKPHKQNHNQPTCTKSRTIKNKERAICTTKTNNKRHGTTNTKIMVQGGRVAPKKMSWFFDDANLKILEAIANGHIQEHIIKHSIISKNATISRLKRMVQEKLFEKSMVQDEIDINKAHIIYKQTKACTKLLVGDDDEPQHRDFRSHHQKWKFELISEAANLKKASEIPCVNVRQMRNHVEKDFFRDSGNTIRLTTKHVCIFVKQRLEADEIDNLNAKYIELSKTEARKFCEEHDIAVNPVPTRYQKNDFDCITAEPLAKLMRERGNFNIKAAGIEARVDPSDKGIESNEENAREIEYRLFKMPAIMKDLQQAITDQTASLQNLAEEHKDSIIQLQSFLKTLGDSQFKMAEIIQAMSGDIKELTKIFKPKEEIEKEPQQPEPDMVMYG